MRIHRLSETRKEEKEKIISLNSLTLDLITVGELYPIGFVAKTHGIKGELNVRLDADCFPEDFRFLVFEMDSIFVPFVVTSSRGKSDDSRLVSLEGVDTVDDAKEFAGKTAYVLKSELEKLPGYGDENDGDDGFYLDDLVGFKLFDADGCEVGEITGYNDDTQNYLLEILLNDGSRHVFVPYVDEWLMDFDAEKKTIKFNLPEGLLD